MKKSILLFLFVISLFALTGCSDKVVDYSTQLTLTTEYEGKSWLTDGIAEVNLVSTVDGDTAHFSEIGSSTTIKIRFLGINTPESTGQIDEWGKAASTYTSEYLENAETIVIESETSTPTLDSTGTRYLAWVWVDGVLLNLLIVQEGYSLYVSVDGSSYNDLILKADLQAQELKLHIWSDEEDPDYYYGDAVTITLKELRENMDYYYNNNMRVAVEGIVVRRDATNAYIETEIEGEHYGLYIYTMYSSVIASALTLGNEIRAVGSVSYYPNYETGAAQLIDVSYTTISSTEDDIKILSTGNEVSPTVRTVDEIDKTINPYLEGTYVRINGLTAIDEDGEDDSYTNDSGTTIVFKDSDGKLIQFRFSSSTLMYQEDGFTKITSYQYFIDMTQDSTMDLAGVVSTYEGEYQILLLSYVDLFYN